MSTLRTPPRWGSRRGSRQQARNALVMVGLLAACAPPKPAMPYPGAPAPEGEPPVEAPLPPGHVPLGDGTVLDVAPVLRGWFTNGVFLAHGRTVEDQAIAWVDERGRLWMIESEIVEDETAIPSQVLAQARPVDGLDLSGRRLRRLERETRSGRLWLLVGHAAGDAWLEVDARGRSTPIVDARAGITDVRRLADGKTHVWTAGPTGDAPARLLARGVTSDEARVLGTLDVGATFAAQPLVVDPDERVLWAAAVEVGGRPSIVQWSRTPTAQGEGLGVTKVPLVPTASSRARGSTGGAVTSAEPRDVVLAADTVDGALVFATWDGARSWISTWSPGRARLTRALERPGRIRQLDVLPGGVVIAVVERPGEHVRERIDLARRRVTEAASLPAWLELLGGVGETSLWTYSSPEMPLTVVRTRWARDGEETTASTGTASTATNTPLLVPDEQTMTAKARCKATWVAAEADDEGQGGVGHWRLDPLANVPVRRDVTRVDRDHDVLRWSADLALACAAGARVVGLAEGDTGGADTASVTWRRHDAASTTWPRTPGAPNSETSSSRDELAEAVDFVEFILGARLTSAPSSDGSVAEEEGRARAAEGRVSDAP